MCHFDYEILIFLMSVNASLVEIDCFVLLKNKIVLFDDKIKDRGNGVSGNIRNKSQQTARVHQSKFQFSRVLFFSIYLKVKFSHVLVFHGSK